MSPRERFPLYDAHCHLQDARLAPFFSQILSQLEAVGVQRVVVNGTRESDWSTVLDLAARDKRILPSLGLHPWYVRDRTDHWFDTLAEAIRAHSAAVGEIGLDRWIKGYNSTVQEDVFRKQLALAASLNRPVSIHCLRAWGSLLDILSSENLPRVGFLLHSYSGPAEMIPQFVKLGAYFSFSGYFAHARKAKQREAFQRVPMERLLLETDAPDMALPAERREFSLSDDLNDPANIRAVYVFAAELFRLKVEDLAVQVEANFRRLFAPTN